MFIFEILLLTRRIALAAFDFVFRGKRFLTRIGSSPDTVGGVQPPSVYASPLVYLIAAGITCSTYGYWVSKSHLAATLLLHSPYFLPFKSILAFVWDKTKDLDVGKLVLLMLPIIICAVLYSVALGAACHIFRLNASQRMLMAITCYFVGTYLFLHSLLFSYSLITVGAFTGRDNLKAPWAFLILHTIVFAAIISTSVTYIRALAFVLASHWLLAVLVILVAFVIFFAVCVPLALVVFPYVLGT
jgi:hypothetical protein